jgi:hypothetical protein
MVGNGRISLRLFLQGPEFWKNFLGGAYFQAPHQNFWGIWS